MRNSILHHLQTNLKRLKLETLGASWILFYAFYAFAKAPSFVQLLWAYYAIQWEHFAQTKGGILQHASRLKRKCFSRVNILPRIMKLLPDNFWNFPVFPNKTSQITVFTETFPWWVAQNSPLDKREFSWIWTNLMFFESEAYRHFKHVTCAMFALLIYQKTIFSFNSVQKQNACNF